MGKILEYLKDERGASAAEYALILALIAGVTVGALTALGHAINNAMGSVTNDLNGASGS